MRRITKKEILNEMMGVPKAIDTWVIVITELMIQGVRTMIENDDWETNDNHSIYHNSLTINEETIQEVTFKIFGVSDISELLKDEKYLDMPLWEPKIGVTLVVLNDDHGIHNVIKKSAQYEAKMKTDTNTLEKIGSVSVLPKTEISVDIMVPRSYIDLTTDKENQIRVYLRSSIAHELTHAYQKYITMVHGDNSFFNKEGMLNAAINVLRQAPIHKNMDTFFHTLYLHLSFEINARVAQLYHSFKHKNIKTKKEFLRELKKSDYWGSYKRLKNFSAEEFLEQDFGDGDGDIFSQVLNMFKEPQDSQQELKDTIEAWDTMLKRVVEYFNDSFDINVEMADVPKKAMEDPYHFFKFWEKRFHKNAESYRRKMLRLASLILNEQ